MHIRVKFCTWEGSWRCSLKQGSSLSLIRHECSAKWTIFEVLQSNELPSTSMRKSESDRTRHSTFTCFSIELDQFDQNVFPNYTCPITNLQTSGINEFRTIPISYWRRYWIRLHNDTFKRGVCQQNMGHRAYYVISCEHPKEMKSVWKKKFGNAKTHKC